MTESHFWSGGRIFTGRRFHEALLIDAGRVVAVGSETEVRAQRPVGVQNHPLNGDVIIPGLIDAHLHLGELALESCQVPLGRTDPIPTLIETARRWAAEHPSGPVVGRGWDLGGRPESEWPRRTDLDRVSTERPVLFYHASGHAVIANSLVLETLGIGRQTPDPPGGRLGRDRIGEPDGRVFEAAARPVTRLAHAALTTEPQALERWLHSAVAYGVSAVGTMNASGEEIAALEASDRRGALPIRVRAWPGLPTFARWDASEVARLRVTGESFSVAGVKAFADGAFGTRTAWLREPYADTPGSVGMPVEPTPLVQEAFERARSLRLSPAIHALGDRGVDVALDCLRPPPAHPAEIPERIEHAGLIPPSLFPKVDRVRPVLVVQPAFVWSDGWLAARLGAGRARWAYPFRTLVEHGHVLAGSSDAPFDVFDPWQGLAAAVQRVSPAGRSANPTPEEALTPEMAIALYTRGGAQALGDPEVGELGPGRRADLVRLAAPSLERAIALGRSCVSETWVDGSGVFEPHSRAP